MAHAMAEFIVDCKVCYNRSDFMTPWHYGCLLQHLSYLPSALLSAIYWSEDTPRLTDSCRVLVLNLVILPVSMWIGDRIVILASAINGLRLLLCPENRE